MPQTVPAWVDGLYWSSLGGLGGALLGAAIGEPLTLMLSGVGILSGAVRAFTGSTLYQFLGSLSMKPIAMQPAKSCCGPPKTASTGHTKPC